MIKLKIKASKTATKKTKDRLKYHGDLWVLIEDGRFEGKDAILARKFMGQYLKWFLKSEIEFTVEDCFRDSESVEKSR